MPSPNNKTQNQKNNSTEKVEKAGTDKEQVQTAQTEEEAPQVEEEEQKTETKQRKRKKQINKDELIPVMNNTAGRLVYTSRKSGETFEFLEYGQEDDIEFGELKTMSNTTQFLRNLRLMILDDEAIEALGLNRAYENALTKDEVERLFELEASQLERKLERIPKEFNELIASLAVRKVDNGTLDSRKKIEIIEHKFNINLTDK